MCELTRLLHAWLPHNHSRNEENRVAYQWGGQGGHKDDGEVQGLAAMCLETHVDRKPGRGRAYGSGADVLWSRDSIIRNPCMRATAPWHNPQRHHSSVHRYARTVMTWSRGSTIGNPCMRGTTP
jgi:hypothetical protein